MSQTDLHSDTTEILSVERRESESLTLSWKVMNMICVCFLTEQLTQINLLKRLAQFLYAWGEDWKAGFGI